MNEILPAVNAGLNSIAAVLLTAGYVTVRRKQFETHRKIMIAASITTAIFFISYVTKTLLYGTTTFGGTGVYRITYLTILFTHLSLAILVLPLSIYTLVSGLRKNFRSHRRIAKWTLPIWLYVSVTGVIVYFMLRPFY